MSVMSRQRMSVPVEWNMAASTALPHWLGHGGSYVGGCSWWPQRPSKVRFSHILQDCQRCFTPGEEFSGRRFYYGSHVDVKYLNGGDWFAAVVRESQRCPKMSYFVVARCHYNQHLLLSGCMYSHCVIVDSIRNTRCMPSITLYYLKHQQPIPAAWKQCPLF